MKEEGRVGVSRMGALPTTIPGLLPATSPEPVPGAVGEEAELLATF